MTSLMLNILLKYLKISLKYLTIWKPYDCKKDWGKICPEYTLVLKTVTLDDKYKKALALHSAKATKEKDISVKIVRK